MQSNVAVGRAIANLDDKIEEALYSTYFALYNESVGSNMHYTVRDLWDDCRAARAANRATLDILEVAIRETS